MPKFELTAIPIQVLSIKTIVVADSHADAVKQYFREGLDPDGHRLDSVEGQGESRDYDGTCEVCSSICFLGDGNEDQDGITVCAPCVREA